MALVQKQMPEDLLFRKGLESPGVRGSAEVLDFSLGVCDRLDGCMNALFAMGIPTTADSRGYFLLLPHLWPVFIVPIVCFYVVLGAWVIRMVWSNRAAGRGSGNHPHKPA